MVALLFYVCIFLVIYSYAIYPVILLVLSFTRKREIVTDQTPSISLIISAFNEEAVIGRKLDNALALDYSEDKLEIIVVSDNSTDKTDEIVRNYTDQGVILLARPVRQGKTAGLNAAVVRANGEIVVFTDADAMYEQSALKQMARLFADPHVGLVTGCTQYVDEGNGKLVETSSLYTRLERFVKRLESRIGSCVGADGAIFAIRKSLYQPLAHDDINDFVIPLKIVKQGYRVLMDKNLYCTEETSPNVKAESRRQIRITNRTLRAIFRHAGLLNPLKFPLFSFQLISHKIVRFCVPFFLLILIPLNVLLLTQGGIYKLLFAGQISFYVAALIGYYQERFGKQSNRFGLFYHFLLVNLSFLLGWFKFLSGHKDVTWDPQKS